MALHLQVEGQGSDQNKIKPMIALWVIMHRGLFSSFDIVISFDKQKYRFSVVHKRLFRIISY